ncbi:MAG: flagellar protein FlgN [Actinobacteria bacterium]|nr:flagellar protein FlgN [Actinomycetota bacterium]
MKIDDVALVDVLRCERESYRDLLELAEREERFILERDAEGLMEVIRATERLIETVRELERERLALISAGLNQTPSQPPQTLSSVMDSLSGTMAAEAARLRDEILEVIEALSEANRTNAELAQRSIGYIDFLLGTLISDDESFCYAEKSVARNSKPRLFDGRA